MYECCDCRTGGIEKQNVETVVQEPTLISNEPVKEMTSLPIAEDKKDEDEIFEVSSLNLAVALGYAGAKQKFALRETHSSSASGMSLRLEDQALLRGTSIVQVLRRLGSELRVNSLSKDFSPQEALELYGRSHEVKKIDYFISHCWQDGRFAKTVALLIHSNLWTAIFVSTVVAFLMSALTRMKLLPAVRPEPEANPHFPWALCIGMLTFFLVLSTWHQPRALLCKLMRRSHAETYTYFLDKFCVHQGDLTLKQQGVRSFAAFVAASNNLLLLWSPQYFTRLWCTLELAALVKSKSHLGTLPLRIMPLQLAKVSLVSWLCAFLIFTVYQFNKVVGKPLPEMAILAASLLVGGYCWSAALRQYARDRKAMHQQIGSFSVQSAKCSDPRDRTWVERTMLRWFADLESCNQHIRRGLEEQISDALGPETHFPTSLAMPIFLVTVFSGLCGCWLLRYSHIPSHHGRHRSSFRRLGLDAGLIQALLALWNAPQLALGGPDQLPLVVGSDGHGFHHVLLELLGRGRRVPRRLDGLHRGAADPFHDVASARITSLPAPRRAEASAGNQRRGPRSSLCGHAGHAET